MIDLSQPAPAPLLAYSDAAFTPGQQPQLGGFAFERSHNVVCAGWMTVEPRVTEVWKPRTQQIFPAEVLAVSAALANHPESFRNRDVSWFIDNESDCSTLIRGASCEEDVCSIAECTALMAMRLNCRIWYEWVDSNAIPSDGRSRLGAADPRYGSISTKGATPEWHALGTDAERFREIQRRF